jgi:hypothetical protein
MKPNDSVLKMCAGTDLKSIEEWGLYGPGIIAGVKERAEAASRGVLVMLRRRDQLHILSRSEVVRT